MAPSAPSRLPRAALARAFPAPMATAASSPKTPTTITSVQVPTATSTKKIPMGIGASGTTATGLPSILPPPKLKLKISYKTKRPASLPALPAILAQATLPIPIAQTTVPAISAALATLLPPLLPINLLQTAPWAKSRTTRVPANAATNWNKIATAIPVAVLAQPPPSLTATGVREPQLQQVQLKSNRNYSQRSASVGSVFAARRAGM